MDLTIDIYSDVICPWCFIGKRRLERALHRVKDLYKPRVTWRTFRLNPSMPMEGMERSAYRIAKFGSLEESRALDARVSAAGSEEDISFSFERIQRVPNTLEAHRFIWLAGRRGHQDEFVESLFRSYFCEGKDIGDPAILLEIAETAGLASDGVNRKESDGDSLEAVRKEEDTARRIGIDSVPAFIINGAYLITGAQYPESLVSVFDQAVKGEIYQE